MEETVTEFPGAAVPTLAELEAAAVAQTGWIEQIPPGHSAIWVGGERAHERVRRGEKVEMPSRRVRIDRIEILEYRYPDLLLEVRCGSGTYLRSLGMDLAAELGTVAVMTELRRTQIGDFHVADAAGELPPNDPPPSDPSNLSLGLTPMPNAGGDRGSIWLTESILPPIEGLRHMLRIDLSPQQAIDARHGLPVSGSHAAPLANEAVSPLEETAPLEETNPIEVGSAAPTQDAVGVDSSGQLVAVLRPKKGLWAPYRVFPPHEWIKMTASQG